MAKDFVHTGEIVDAVIAVLKGSGSTHVGGLPVAWFTSGSNEYLRVIEHGDWADYGKANRRIDEDLPAIFVRGMGPTLITGHLTGVDATEERIRVVHVRRFDQCYGDDGSAAYTKTGIGMVRARERYAKIISKALFNDPHRKLAVIDGAGARTEVSLTTTDAAAQVVNVLWRGWDLGHPIGSEYSTEDVAGIRALELPIWAIACDLAVHIRTGGPA